MKIFKKESLESLRQKVDLVDLLSSHLRLIRAGASYKALCPFHEEKTPSFIVQSGDTHYHCFGCSAHGDAISFLMNYQKLTFQEAVESLAERYGLILEYEDNRGEKETFDKKDLKDALQKAQKFFNFCLLHTKDGHEALQYLYKRGLDLNFIRTFQIGYAPKGELFLKVAAEQKIPLVTLKDAGLVSNNTGKYKEFFSDRITIPIHDQLGNVIGFSARKFKEETFGPKYINTPETPLFKKSKILFGLNYCRRRIAKEKKAIIVEGQFDALRLISAGFDYTVAGQGTAFGERHVQELLNLGVNKVFLSLDPDTAGQEATEKIGNLLQKEAIEVRVVELPEKYDPDAFIRKTNSAAFENLLTDSIDFLNFLVKKYSKSFDNSPAGKNSLVTLLTKKIEDWRHPLLIFESLKELSNLTNTPLSLLKKNAVVDIKVEDKKIEIDADKILECDLLRWLFVTGDENLIRIAKKNLKESHFKIPSCRSLYCKYIERFNAGAALDLISWHIELEDSLEEKSLLSIILEKKINQEKSKAFFLATIQKILDRAWMEEREKIKNQINSKGNSEESLLELAKKFDDLKRPKPIIVT